MKENDKIIKSLKRKKAPVFTWSQDYEEEKQNEEGYDEEKVEEEKRKKAEEDEDDEMFQSQIMKQIRLKRMEPKYNKDDNNDKNKNKVKVNGDKKDNNSDDKNENVQQAKMTNVGRKRNENGVNLALKRSNHNLESMINTIEFLIKKKVESIYELECYYLKVPNHLLDVLKGKIIDKFIPINIDNDLVDLKEVKMSKDEDKAWRLKTKLHKEYTKINGQRLIARKLVEKRKYVRKTEQEYP